jgi:Probable zinc-ribbon domain
MKSGKQRRQELKARRQARQTKLIQLLQANTGAEQEALYHTALVDGGIPVDCTALAPNNSYGEPEFVRRRYYIDKSFTCARCGSEEVWTAAQQKWWYEVAFMQCIYHRKVLPNLSQSRI